MTDYLFDPKDQSGKSNLFSGDSESLSNRNYSIFDIGFGLLCALFQTSVVSSYGRIVVRSYRRTVVSSYGRIVVRSYRRDDCLSNPLPHQRRTQPLLKLKIQHKLYNR